MACLARRVFNKEIGFSLTASPHVCTCLQDELKEAIEAGIECAKACFVDGLNRLHDDDYIEPHMYPESHDYDLHVNVPSCVDSPVVRDCASLPRRPFLIISSCT